MINLHKIFTTCSRKNTNSKYINKLWQLIKSSLLVVTTLTSQCVVSTSLLVSTGAVSCYPASMVNSIWFANKKCLSC